MGICTTLHSRACVALLSAGSLHRALSRRVADLWSRHPVYQEYTPPMVSSADILLPEGAGKEWDERLLLQWEHRANQGREWAERSDRGQGREVEVERDRGRGREKEFNSCRG